MNDYWYYTLSAVPQTLAAMIALAATFFVFRLDFLSEEMRKNRKDLARFLLLLAQEQGEIHNIETKSDEDFFIFYKEMLDKIKPDEDKFGLPPETYAKLEQEMQRIIHEDWKSFFLPRSFRIAKYLDMKKDNFEKLLSTKSTIHWLLGSSLLTVALTIIISLFALPNYDVFCNPRSIVGLVLIGSLASVVLTTYSVWRIATVRF